MEKERKEKMNNNLAMDLEPEKISYADLLKFDDDKRYELIDGVPYLMASPSVAHQRVLLEIAKQIGDYLEGKKCEVFISPLDVKLSGAIDDSEEFNVVQPDIMVVCDKDKITEKNIVGAPDLAIEILSPSNIRHDRMRKLKLYQKFGVREYWMVSIEEQNIMVLTLSEEGIYQIAEACYLDEKVKVNVLDNCFVDLKEFCENNNIVVKKSKEYLELIAKEAEEKEKTQQ